MNSNINLGVQIHIWAQKTVKMKPLSVFVIHLHSLAHFITPSERKEDLCPLKCGGEDFGKEILPVRRGKRLRAS
jgi:hypothetical protein